MGSYRAISSVADKSFQLLLKTTAPPQTQGGRVGKQECSPKALRALVQDTPAYTVTHGQLTQKHMSCHMQLHSCLAYQHTRHSRIQLRAQQVFTPQDLLCRPAARCTQRERMACWGTTPPSAPQRHTVPLAQPPSLTQNKRQRAVSQNKQLKQTGNILSQKCMKEDVSNEGGGKRPATFTDPTANNLLRRHQPCADKCNAHP